MADCPDPGIYPDVSFDEYYGWEAANATLLKAIDKRTPLHARTSQLEPRAPTPAMQLGDAIHACILEPDRFEGEYAKGLEVDKRSKANKEAWAAHQEENAGKTLLSVKDFERCEQMRARAVGGHADVAHLLGAEGATEVCMVWVDKRTNLACKARVDKFTTYGDWPVLVDLKSCQDASGWKFSRDCHTFGYALQAAHYLDGAHTLSPRDRQFLFIAIEKDAPWAAQIHELGQDSLRTGELARRRALRRWATCLETGEFPGYPPGVSAIELPEFAIDLDESLTEGD